MSDRASDDNGPTVDTGSSKAPVGALLRPNALPTDTAVLFLLLVITFVTSSLYLFQFLYIGLNARTFGDTMLRCASASPPGGGKLTSVVMAEVDAFTACTAEVSKEEVTYALVGALLVVVIAWVLYRLRPAWRERRGGLEPAEGPDLAYLKGGVDALATQASVAAPAVLLDPANPSVSAFAYGAGKELRIGVTGGLVVQQSLDPPMFDAVVRHELGHLANRDVPWTFYTLSAWWSFLVAALLPVTLVALVNARQYLLQLGIRVAALTVMLGVVGAALLRIREAYADARAAEWGWAAQWMRSSRHRESPKVADRNGCEPTPHRRAGASSSQTPTDCSGSGGSSQSRRESLPVRRSRHSTTWLDSSYRRLQPCSSLRYRWRC
jgi:Zn-dependent protease with chaperone function